MTNDMRKLGITVEEITFVYTVFPITEALGPPIAGFIADKLGNYKNVLVINLVITVASSGAIKFVPSSGHPNSTISHSLTFWLYFCLRVTFQISLSICFSLLDASTLVMCKKHGSSFGKERFWAILATGLFTPICSTLELSINYSPSFHFFNALVILTLITLLVMDIEVEPPSKNLLKKLKPYLKSPNIWSLLLVILVLGTEWGFVETYLFWYLT
jgi:MFS family permease